MINRSFIFIKRNTLFSIVLCITLFIVFVGELLSFSLTNLARRGEDEAYDYNGFALFIGAENTLLNDDDYEYIKSVEHVTGIGGHFREIVAAPIGATNVKEHTGATVAEEHTEDADNIVLVAMMNIEKYDLFRREKNVSLIEGSFPDKDGILIESRFAKQNNISVGDCLRLETLQEEISLEVKGIYLADTDFEVLDTNDVSDSVYIYSPYNTMYMEYEYALEIFDWIEDNRGYGCNVYVDRPENVEYVADAINNQMGTRVSIYDNTTSYIDDQCSLIKSLLSISRLLQITILIVGTILIFIVFSFVYEEIKKDTAIYLMLGEKKSIIIWQNIGMIISYSLISLVGVVLVFLLSTNLIINVINKSIYLYATANSNRFATLYLTPGIENRFYLELSRADIFNASNMRRLISIFIYAIGLSSIMPIIASVKGQPKRLIKQ